MRFLPSTSPPPAPEVLRAWSAFIVDGTLDEAVVRPHIGRAWARSRAGGCDPRRARADVLSTPQTIELLQKERRLIEVATPFLLALSRAAGQERHAAMLADRSGRVLRIVGDAETMADEDFPHAGALLSESAAGANGVGTTLAEGGYVELVGPEHYIEGFHVFTCQGVPLLTAPNEPAGVLSMSVRRVETAKSVRDILFCASEAAECELLAAGLADILVRVRDTPAVLEGLRQDVLQRIAMARLQLEIAARQIAGGADATTTLQAAHRLVIHFQRQAAVWRNLVGEGCAVPEPVVLPDLVHDFCGLLETEARVACVTLLLRRMDPLTVLADARQLSQRLLTAFLDAMQASQREGQLPIDVESRNGQGVVAVHARSPDGRAHVFEASSPLLR